MGLFYYSVVLELYRQPPGAVTAKEHEKSCLPDVYLPPFDTDIFTSSLPSHDRLSWEEAERQQRLVQRPQIQSAISHSSLPDIARTTLDDLRTSFASTSIGDVQRRPVPNKPIVASADARETALTSDDWRFGQVSIQSIDMALLDPGDDGRARALCVTQAARPNPPGVVATRGQYIPSDPKNTEVGWGVIRLYRNAKESTEVADLDLPGASRQNLPLEANKPADREEQLCTTLCILAVPSYMTPSDLLGFVGEQTREDVTHFRLIRTARANKYMVLMKFRDAHKAKLWQQNWNGKHFNSMDPENCHVVFISSVQFSSRETEQGPSSFPDMSNDPFTPSKLASSQAVATSGSMIASGIPQAQVELPTCPVCLERMDESTGLLTILCQHVFHCNCLEKWKGSGCPVCRYTQNESNIDDDQDSECSVCSSTTNLWVCLICGNVGCGRYDSAHAFAHYEATKHSYAMDITTQHVWDYVGDGYVHRLISTKGEGKAGETLGTGMTAYSNEDVPREKLDNMGMEFALMISSQLESQRLYYEDLLDRAVDKASHATAAADNASRAVSDLTMRMEILRGDLSTAQADSAKLEKEMQRAQKRADKAEVLARRMTKDWQEEKAVGEGLAKRIAHVQEKMAEVEGKVAALTAEKQELEEQNRDLTFFISGQAKLKELEGEEAEEIMGGKVEVPVTETGKRRKGKGKKQ